MLIPYRKQDKWGFVDENKKMVIDFIYDQIIAPFSRKNHGLAIVYKDRKSAWIDKTGHLLTPWACCCHEFDSNELSKVILSDEKQPGYCLFLNSDGQIAFEQNYSFAGAFCNGVCNVMDAAGKIGAINTKGEIVAPLIYNNWEEVDKITGAGPIIDHKPSTINNAIVTFRPGNGLIGLKNLAGGIIAPANLRHFFNLHDQDTVAIGTYNEFWHIDNEGKRLYDKNYTYAENFNEGIARVVTTAPAEDPYIHIRWEVYYFIPKDAKWGYINKKGEEFWDDGP